MAATVIQWLGSPVGQSFLEDLGYVKRISRAEYSLEQTKAGTRPTLSEKLRKKKYGLPGEKEDAQLERIKQAITITKFKEALQNFIKVATEVEKEL